MTPTEIIEYHIKVEQEHYEKMNNSYTYSSRETYNQHLLVQKLKQILQEIKEQENGH
jgi:hypothetical protein